jgi:hypothetical protein
MDTLITILSIALGIGYAAIAIALCISAYKNLRSQPVKEDYEVLYAEAMNTIDALNDSYQERVNELELELWDVKQDAKLTVDEWKAEVILRSSLQREIYLMKQALNLN